jgi:5'-nucleotidase
MRLLICNDDGVHAPGIKSLRNHLKDIADLTVVAPLEQRSASGHCITTETPMRLIELEDQVYGCSGYPADCALMGIGHVMKKDRPDLLVSGVNYGVNSGQDIYYSGTVAAAREGSFHGVPGIAVSCAVNFGATAQDEAKYYTAAEFIKFLVENDVQHYIPNRTVLNINVPDLEKNEIKDIKVTQAGFKDYTDDIEERVDARNRKYYWLANYCKEIESTPGHDSYEVTQGYITLTLLEIFGHNQESHKRIEDLRDMAREFLK